MPFHFLREKRRREWREEPFPDAWREYLAENVGHYSYLSEAETARLHDDLRVFLAEKGWEGGGGLTLAEEIKVNVSAQACLLLLGFERHDYFPNVRSIVVYPAGYHAPRRERDGYIVTENTNHLQGEAWSSNLPVVLSWVDTLHGGAVPDDGHNVVLHEFAHKLDLIDGGADGVPRLRDAAQYDAWAEVMSREFALLRTETQFGQETLLNDYGATNEAEFFAVATETFFEKPRQMRHQCPKLYDVLREYYGQDPARRVDEKRGAAEAADDGGSEETQ